MEMLLEDNKALITRAKKPKKVKTNEDDFTKDELASLFGEPLPEEELKVYNFDEASTWDLLVTVGLRHKTLLVGLFGLLGWILYLT